jgi:signal peptidase I
MHARITLFILLLTLCSGCEKKFTIAGRGMEPTLAAGDKATFVWPARSMKRGDVVAYQDPRDTSKFVIARVIGLSGETIGMTNGHVMVDGRPLQEGYVTDANRALESWGPVTVPSGDYFLLGDNRRNSMDSRTWGPVHAIAIAAKLVQ